LFSPLLLFAEHCFNVGFVFILAAETYMCVAAMRPDLSMMNVVGSEAAPYSCARLSLLTITGR